MDPVNLTRRLIDIPSITGAEAGLAVEIENLCASFGWMCEREYIEDNRWNLYVNWRSHATVVFCTHIDTVPPHFPSRIDERFIHGRGACDTKGIIAAMLCAGERLHADGIVPAFLFVVGEETGSEGAKIAARSHRTADYIIVGEPTDNIPAAGHKGALSYTLSVQGIAAHSSLPHKGVSAIEKLLSVLRDIMEISWESHPVLGDTTTSITGIGGGTAINIIPADAWANVFHRITVPLETALDIVTRCVGDRATVTFRSMTNPQELVVIDGSPSTVVSFGTDVPYLRTLGAPLLVGPGSIEDAHTMEEKISIAQLREAVPLFVTLYHTLSRLIHAKK